MRRSQKRKLSRTTNLWLNQSRTPGILAASLLLTQRTFSICICMPIISVYIYSHILAINYSHLCACMYECVNVAWILIFSNPLWLKMWSVDLKNGQHQELIRGEESQAVPEIYCIAAWSLIGSPGDSYALNLRNTVLTIPSFLEWRSVVILSPEIIQSIRYICWFLISLFSLALNFPFPSSC